MPKCRILMRTAVLKIKLIILYSEINPSLASHGQVHSQVLEDTKVVLRFGGGCQGCGCLDNERQKKL